MGSMAGHLLHPVRKGGPMKLSILAAGVALAFSLFNMGCSKTERTAADRPGSATNPPAQADRSAPAGNLSAADREFATKAAQGGMAEVEMGNVAQQQGSTDQMKDLGRKLVQADN